MAGDEPTTAACPGAACEVLGRWANIRTPTITTMAMTTRRRRRGRRPGRNPRPRLDPRLDGRGGRDERDSGVRPEVGQRSPYVHAMPAGGAEHARTARRSVPQCSQVVDVPAAGARRSRGRRDDPGAPIELASSCAASTSSATESTCAVAAAEPARAAPAPSGNATGTRRRVDRHRFGFRMRRGRGRPSAWPIPTVTRPREPRRFVIRLGTASPAAAGPARRCGGSGPDLSTIGIDMPTGRAVRSAGLTAPADRPAEGAGSAPARRLEGRQPRPRRVGCPRW